MSHIAPIRCAIYTVFGNEGSKNWRPFVVPSTWCLEIRLQKLTYIRCAIYMVFGNQASKIDIYSLRHLHGVWKSVLQKTTSILDRFGDHDLAGKGKLMAQPKWACRGCAIHFGQNGKASTLNLERLNFFSLRKLITHARLHKMYSDCLGTFFFYKVDGASTRTAPCILRSFFTVG